MRVWSLLFCTLCVLISASDSSDPEADTVRYDNYQLIEFTPHGKAQRRIFEKMKHHSTGNIFLNSSPLDGVAWLVAIPPYSVHGFRKHLKHTRNHRVVHSNLQSMLVTSDKQRNIAPQSVDWTNYLTLDSMYAWMDEVVRKHPQQVTGIVVGTSFEKRPIRGLRIAFGDGTPKPAVFIESGIHAREWIGPAMGTYLINQLVNSEDVTIRDAAESYVWYIVPSVNPDGYAYTNIDRLWRKTRSPSTDSNYPSCKGADPNRNWDIHWNTTGSSGDQCDQTFAGSAAFSEVEMKNLAQYLESVKDQLIAYISFHSYSQLLLYPYGYTELAAATKDQLQTIGLAAAEALRKLYGTQYKVGPISTTIYPVSGSTVDYAYDKLKVPLSYTYELRPRNSILATGFELPASQIIPVGKETVASVVAMLKKAKSMDIYLRH